MHEYSIVQALLARVERECLSHHAIRVHRLHVRIGSLSGVEPDLLASAFAAFKERTYCESAELSIERVAERWACPSCDGVREPRSSLVCMRCALPLRLVAGDEIVLQRIEMEVA